MKISYIVGDATNPSEEIEGTKFIAHCCNNIGGWGRGFVLALSRKWGMPEIMYRHIAKENKDNFRTHLGKIQVCPVEKDIVVINIIGQDDIVTKDGIPPIRYEAIREGLIKLNEHMSNQKTSCTLHIPRIGCGLAGATWDKIEPIIQETMDFDTYVYTLPNEMKKYGM